MNLAQVVHDYVSLKQSMGSRFCTEATILKAFCKAVRNVSMHLRQGAGEISVARQARCRRARVVSAD
jgi:uncharacterized membrane-anchored protein YhcB (DUF1043 family)